jgi:hypothetical protein
MPHYSGDTITVDAEDLVADLRAEQQRIEAEADRIGSDGFDITNSEFLTLADDETADGVTDEQFRDALREEYVERKHQIDELETRFHEWGGSKFTLRHLTAGDIARRGDWVNAKALSENAKDIRSQSHATRIITVAIGVTKMPGEAGPEKEDGIKYVRERLPTVLVRWLYDKIENLTNYGEADLDDFSDLPPSLAPNSGSN